MVMVRVVLRVQSYIHTESGIRRLSDRVYALTGKY